jgi:hypothetical protein
MLGKPPWSHRKCKCKRKRNRKCKRSPLMLMLMLMPSLMMMSPLFSGDADTASSPSLAHAWRSPLMLMLMPSLMMMGPFFSGDAAMASFLSLVHAWSLKQASLSPCPMMMSPFFSGDAAMVLMVVAQQVLLALLLALLLASRLLAARLRHILRFRCVNLLSCRVHRLVLRVLRCPSRVMLRCRLRVLRCCVLPLPLRLSPKWLRMVNVVLTSFAWLQP